MMKINENYFLKTCDYAITNGYCDGNYYCVIIFNELYKQNEFVNLFKKISDNMENFDIMMNIYHNNEEKTIIAQCIVNKEKTFLESKDIKVKIGINNINKNYIKSELPIKVDNNNHIYCYDYFTSENCPFKYSKSVMIKDIENKTSIFKFF